MKTRQRHLAKAAVEPALPEGGSACRWMGSERLSADKQLFKGLILLEALLEILRPAGSILPASQWGGTSPNCAWDVLWGPLEADGRFLSLKVEKHLRNLRQTLFPVRGYQRKLDEFVMVA